MNALHSQKPLRVFYIGLEFDYGQPSRGYSYEYVNFLGTLQRMQNLQVEFFPFDVAMREVGRTSMNEQLLRKVKEYKPDVCFFVLFTDEIEPRTIRAISEESGATTLNWFGDDHWRFSSFSKHFAPGFHWVLTTDSLAVEKYRAIGCSNVIKTQWGVNHHLYNRSVSQQDIDIAFVGQVHSQRKKTIGKLQRAGIDVKCWGRGWNNGRLSQEDMIKTYSRSKINLNFTESSMGFSWKPVVKTVLNRRADGTIQINPVSTIMGNLSALLHERRPQIKGRNFEIPGAGGFLLTSHADNLDEYFVPGEEIAVFNSVDDLIEKARYYLSHHDEREKIREAGYKRTLVEHTYEQRFREILRAIGYEKV